MTRAPRPPDLSFIIPAANENRWSDLLASMISTDPRPIARSVGAEPDGVRREVGVPGQQGRRSDRLDLLLIRDGRQLAAIEVKVLSDLGIQQLARYRAAFPDAESHYVLHLGQLPVHHRSAPGWQSLTWEAVLEAYSTSEHLWVSATAQAWLAQLPSLVPQVDADTVWNEVPDDAAGFELSLRAKVAWLANRMDGWCQIDHYLSMSSGGGAWATTMRTPAASPDHWALAELQEGLAAQDWRLDAARPYRSRLVGPVVLVGLSHDGESTSAGFDWLLLARLFRDRIVDGSGHIIDGRPWQTTSANPKNVTDRANWVAMVAAGAPRWLGKGYGMATALTHQVCAFGARIQFPPSSTLGQVDADLRDLQSLIVELGRDL